MKTGGIIISALIPLFITITSCSTPMPDKSQVQNSSYNEQYRPQFHFSPDSMWMNDPNGMVYYEGEYHLFYQYHPHSNVWGPMHWGHAITTDLVHWEHLPIALYPDSLGTIFSGSAVIDWNNSSGLGSSAYPPMVAIFTHHNHALEKTESQVFQYQSIAYSLDKGRSWAKYPGNPVVQNPGIRDFRDPKVSWYEEGQKWIMVFAAQDRIMFYSSPDLLQWEKESEFTAELAPDEGVWECPDFFPLSSGGDTKWVLLVSIGGGGPNGGSGTKYYIGEFDGKKFSSDDPPDGARWVDYGKDNYAGVTWSDIPSTDGRRIFLGWMSNWQYAGNVPTERWRSAMTLPRELKLGKDEQGYLLTSEPVVETELLREKQFKLDPGPLKGKIDVGPKVEDSYPLYELDLVFEFDPNKKEGVEFGIILESEQQEKLVVTYTTQTQQISIKRGMSGKSDFSVHFPGDHWAPYQSSEAGEIRFHAFVDMSSIELFVDDGSLVMTELFFPESGFESIQLFANQESVLLKEGVIYTLKSIW